MRPAARSLRASAPATLVCAIMCLGVVSAMSVAAGPACVEDGRVLRFGFYAYFDPVSYSADGRPGTDGFDVHLGYEADLLSALEAMEGTELVFSRSGIARWDGIWQRPTGVRYDIVGGGITVLDARTRDMSGKRTVVFTSGHIAFRQSLLVRAGDAGWIARHADLTRDVRVGVLAGTTGEARLLELTGLTDADGIMATGTRIEAGDGVLVADGGADYAIRASGASPALKDRRLLYPPTHAQPQVVYLGDDSDEEELLDALRSGRIDAFAGAEIGNHDAAAESRGALVVTALDERTEHGGFALAAKDAALAGCLDRRIDWLTDGRKIGYGNWREDPSVFMRRAEDWPPEEKRQ